MQQQRFLGDFSRRHPCKCWTNWTSGRTHVLNQPKGHRPLSQHKHRRKITSPHLHLSFSADSEVIAVKEKALGGDGGGKSIPQYYLTAAFLLAFLVLALSHWSFPNIIWKSMCIKGSFATYKTDKYTSCSVWSLWTVRRTVTFPCCHALCYLLSLVKIQRDKEKSRWLTRRRAEVMGKSVNGLFCRLWQSLTVHLHHRATVSNAHPFLENYSFLEETISDLGLWGLVLSHGECYWDHKYV